MKKTKGVSQEEATKYCFENCTIARLGEKNYHKYRSYKRRYEKGETLSYNALHAMYYDFGIITQCEYILPSEKTVKAIKGVKAIQRIGSKKKDK